MKTRTIAKILLCTLPVSYIQHGYAMETNNSHMNMKNSKDTNISTSMNINNNNINSQTISMQNFIVGQGDQEKILADVLKLRYVGKLLSLTLYAKCKSAHGGSGGDDLRYLCEQVSDAACELDIFDRNSGNRIDSFVLPNICTQEETKKDASDVVRPMRLSELDLVDKQTLFDCILNSTLLTLFHPSGEEVGIEDAVCMTCQGLLAAFLGEKGLEAKTEAEVEGLLYLQEQLLRAGSKVAESLLYLGINSFKADHWKALANEVEIIDETTATLTDPKDELVSYKFYRTPGSENEEEKIDVYRVDSDGNMIQKFIDLSNGKMFLNYKPLNEKFECCVTNAIGSKAVVYGAEDDDNFKQIIGACLDQVLLTPELMAQIGRVCNKLSDEKNKKEPDCVNVVRSINELYKFLDKMDLEADNKEEYYNNEIKQLATDAVETIYNSNSFIDYCRNVDFNKHRYNYADICDFLMAVISEASYHVDLKPIGLTTLEGYKISMDCLEPYDDIDEFVRTMLKNDVSFGDALVLFGSDTQGSFEDSLVRKAVVQFPVQLFVKNELYCLTGYMTINEAGKPKVVNLSKKDILGISHDGETNAFEAVMAVYRKAYKLGLKQQQPKSNVPYDQGIVSAQNNNIVQLNSMNTNNDFNQEKPQNDNNINENPGEENKENENNQENNENNDMENIDNENNINNEEQNNEEQKEEQKEEKDKEKEEEKEEEKENNENGDQADE